MPTLPISRFPTLSPAAKKKSTSPISQATLGPTVSLRNQAAEFSLVLRIGRELNKDEAAVFEDGLEKYLSKFSNSKNDNINDIRVELKSQNVTQGQQQNRRVLMSKNTVNFVVEANYKGANTVFDLYQAFTTVLDYVTNDMIAVWVTLMNEKLEETNGAENIFETLYTPDSDPPASSPSSSGMSPGGIGALVAACVFVVGISIFGGAYAFLHYNFWIKVTETSTNHMATNPSTKELSESDGKESVVSDDSDGFSVSTTPDSVAPTLNGSFRSSTSLLARKGSFMDSDMFSGESCDGSGGGTIGTNSQSNEDIPSSPMDAKLLERKRLNRSLSLDGLPPLDPALQDNGELAKFLFHSKTDHVSKPTVNSL